MTLQKDPERTETKYLHQFADFTGKRVLEIGCGDGRLTWQYAKSARFVAGIDLEANDLRVATIERPSDVPASLRARRFGPYSSNERKIRYCHPRLVLLMNCA
jgi:predicted TPR repeat methyltransferase